VDGTVSVSIETGAPGSVCAAFHNDVDGCDSAVWFVTTLLDVVAHVAYLVPSEVSELEFVVRERRR